MKDHHLADDGPDAGLPAPIVHGTLSGGLGRDQLLGDFATVQITVGPWDFPQMTDIIVLHWGEQWDDELPVTDTNGAQLLSIPGINIAGDRLGDGDHYTGEGTQAVWYEIRTASGTVKPSATTRVVVKTARPGGQDPLPDTHVNDNLATPTASPDPVEAGTIEVIFSVKPWKNIAIDDKLVLVVGGSAFPFPALADIATIQTLTLSAEQIAAIGGGPKTPVSYQITDRVGNLSGYAPYLPLDIWLETGDRLEMIELTDDAGAFIEDAINPAMSKGKAIVPRYKGWAVGESVTVVLEGVDSNGQEFTTTLGPKLWEATLFYLEFKILNEDLLVLAGGIVRVYYQTSANKFSFRRLYVVNALPQTGLPPVFVRGEHGDELPLDDIVGDYVNIVVPDSEALIDFARITLTMEGSGASGPVHEEETHNVGEGEGHTPYAFVWLKTRVDPLLERTATFRYSVRTLDAAPQGRSAGPRLYRRPLSLRGLRGIRDSEPHDLFVKRSSSGGQLPAPIVVDLVDGAVSPTLPTLKLTVPGGAASTPGAKVVTTVVGLTTATRTDVIFDQGETLHVDFPGWPSVNDGAKATASYTIEGTPSKEATFDVGAAVPFQIDQSPVEIDIDQDYPREATGGTLPYTYTSNAPTIVSVPAAGTGLIRGVAAGTATITARDSAQGIGQYAVTVKNEAGPFAIDDDLVTLDVNADYTRHATGGTLPYKYTSNSAIVSVPDINNGVIIAKAAGTAMITARDNAGASGSYPVIVSDTTTPFHISPSQVSITDTESYTRNATGGTPPYTYISSNTAVVTVPNLHYGVIQANAAGDATIIASDSAGAGGSYPVVVTSATPPFAISDELVVLAVNEDYTREASDGEQPYSYGSSNPGVVSVPNLNQGLIHSIANGSAVITARDSAGHSASYPVAIVQEETQTFDNLAPSTIPAGVSLDIGNMTITGPAIIATYGPPNDKVVLIYNGARVTFKSGMSRVSFDVRTYFGDGSNATVAVIDERGEVIVREGVSGSPFYPVTFSAPPGRKIVSLSFDNAVALDYVYLDNFRMMP